MLRAPFANSKRATLLIFVYASLFGFFDAWAADAPHKFGWKSSPHGIAGAPIETHPLFKAAPLPRSASVAQYFYRTDQKDRGACVAFSGVEAYDAVFQKNNGGAHVYLSPLDTYQQCLIRDKSFPNDNGTYGGTLLQVFKFGVLTEKTWPYSMALNMLAPANDATFAERSQNTTVKSYALPSNDGGYAVKQCIANLKIPVLMGSYWYNNGFDAKLVKCRTKVGGKSATVNRYVLPYPKGSPVGGHEVPVVSYDDDMVFPGGEVGGMEIHNHWVGFGDPRGSAWLPQKWGFNPRIVEDKHAIELVSKPPPVPAPAPRAAIPVVLTP